MPIRYITAPAPVQFVDPSTNEALAEKPVTLEMLIMRLMANPIWSESYANTKAQYEVMQALKKQTDGVMALGEDDWQKLKQAAESPRIMGYNPVICYQLLPLLSAIMDAPTTDPRAPKPASS